jgi:hypothetical protein
MRRLGTVALSVVALALPIGMVVYQLIPEDSVTKASVNRALVDFRKQMKRAADYPRHPQAQIPPFGVYRYSTKGRESIETLAFTTAHGYHGVSTVSLIPIPCGVKERWQPLVERWFEGRLCVKRNSTRVVAVRDFHEFFDESRLVNYRCTGDSPPYASALEPGDRWQTRCTSDQGTVTSNVEVVRLEKIGVAGRRVEAVRLRARAALDGDPEGSSRQESWIRRSDGLLLRRVNESAADVEAAGGGTFTERYEIRLISAKPQR